MITETLYYVGVHNWSFRPNQPAEIVGVKMVVPTGLTIRRPCFEVRYEDGIVDFCPINADHAYKLLTKDELPELANFPKP